MKITLQSICMNQFVKKDTRKRSFMELDYLHETRDLSLTKQIFSRIYFGRHEMHYKRMIHLVRMLFELKSVSYKMELVYGKT
ncbi:hypothetical protein J2S09_002536 [Bacillus fengqiuensis]|nr:hypothetical protein [Bacillus fengqiuensis]